MAENSTYYQEGLVFGGNQTTHLMETQTVNRNNQVIQLEVRIIRENVGYDGETVFPERYRISLWNQTTGERVAFGLG